MQLEHEACLDEINWVIRYHICEALNCPLEEYPSRPLPIPPDYIDNLQSRSIKVKKDILPPTLKMILKTHYHPPARQAPITSPAVQPDYMMGRHRDGEHNPQERPRASEEEEKYLQTAPRPQTRGKFCFPNRGRDGQRVITNRRSPFRNGDLSATSRDNSDEHRSGGRLPHSSRLRGKPGNSDSSKSRRPRGG